MRSLLAFARDTSNRDEGQAERSFALAYRDVLVSLPCSASTFVALLSDVTTLATRRRPLVEQSSECTAA